MKRLLIKILRRIHRINNSRLRCDNTADNIDAHYHSYCYNKPLKFAITFYVLLPTGNGEENKHDRGWEITWKNLNLGVVNCEEATHVALEHK